MKVKLKNKNYIGSSLNPCINTKFEIEGKVLTKLEDDNIIRIVSVRWDNGNLNFYDIDDLIFLSGENKKDNFNSIW